jgi:membrane-associated phospholipid phosphatase
MTEPGTTPPESFPPPFERRSRPRRHSVVLFWDVVFRTLRLLAGRAGNFYQSVGIFLVAGAILAVAGVLGFAQLGRYVRGGATQAFDEGVLRWIGAHQSRMITAVMVEVTPLGTGTVVLTIVGIAALFLWHTEHKHSARLLLAATAGNILLNGVLKLYFSRPRPQVFEWDTHAASSSFPSGHAMSATVVYGTVAYLVARLQRHTLSRIATLTAAVILIALICATRLYLGVHYPSDVLGGVVVGLAWSAFCMATLEASLALERRRGNVDRIEERPAPTEPA